MVVISDLTDLNKATRQDFDRQSLKPFRWGELCSKKIKAWPVLLFVKINFLNRGCVHGGGGGV